MSDNDLIRRGDVMDLFDDWWLYAPSGQQVTNDVCDAIAALPAVTVGVKPLVWDEDFADHPFGWYETIDCGDCIVLTQSGVTVGSFPTIDAAKAAAQADYEARTLAALPAVTPAQDAAAIREAWEKAYWHMRSYAVHDNDCNRNKPPRFEGPCSCGLTAALAEALALLTEKPHDR